MFRKKKSLLLFLLPGEFMLLIFHLIPLAGSIYLSLVDGSKAQRFIGLENYMRVWNNPMFQTGLKNSLELSLLCAPALWLFSFFLSAWLVELLPLGKRTGSVLLLPYLMPSSAILFVWMILFDYGGPVNRIVFGITGTRILWLESSALRIPVILLFLWKNLGFCTVIFMAALQSVPKPLYEFARLEGAGFVTRTIRISLPMVLPSAYFSMIIAWMNAFRIFREVYFIAGGYPDRHVYTLQHYMNNMFSKMNYQYVTSSANFFTLIMMAFFGLTFIFQHRALKSMGGGK